MISKKRKSKRIDMTTPTPESVKRYPLEWPLGWRRVRSRRHGDFRMTREDRLSDGQTRRRSTPVNMAAATERLERQMELLGAREPTLSTNVSLSMRGVPRGDENPSDPGAAVYFKFKGKATVLACDTYYRVAENIAALAAHIDALRRIDRYGVGTIEQALAGYKALPADSAADWRVALFGANPPNPITLAAVDSAYKYLAKEYHPDFTHDDGARMAWLNRARDYAMAELTQ
jgi:hypothetical protein